MEIWPAIDLRGGLCVRLQQGDYARETVFGDDPAAVAKHWVEQGARRLHLVDLDGARDGRPANLEGVKAILKAVSVPCELGGGIRDEETIATLLDAGLARLVIGTRALKAHDWFRHVCRRFAGRLVLGLDARNGWVATDGWLETSQTRATDVLQAFRDEPLAAVVYTDIATDGMMAGPNFEAVLELSKGTNVPVIASGGVTTIDDVAKLAQANVAGCIVGRSLYEGRMLLPEALAAAGDVA